MAAGRLVTIRENSATRVEVALVLNMTTRRAATYAG